MIDLSLLGMKKLVHTEVVKERLLIRLAPLCLLLVVNKPLKWLGTTRIVRSMSGSPAHSSRSRPRSSLLLQSTPPGFERRISTQCWDVLEGRNDLEVPDLVHSQIASPGLIDSACWKGLPSSYWFESPLGRRAALGHNLLNISRQKASAPSASMIPPLLLIGLTFGKAHFIVGFLSV